MLEEPINRDYLLVSKAYASGVASQLTVNNDGGDGAGSICGIMRELQHDRG
jgi:hypothetical protein